MEKHALEFIDCGNDVQALAKIDGEAESLCGVSRGENLMIQTQTAIAFEIIKKNVRWRTI